MERSACHGKPAEPFFPTFHRHRGPSQPHHYEQARRDAQTALAYCRVCPVRAECLEWADAYETNLDLIHGVFGGLTELERRVRFTRRRRGTRGGPLHGTQEMYLRG